MIFSELLEKAGFTIVDNLEKADVVIINSCAVKTPAENKFFNYLEKTRTENKIIIAAGCIAQIYPEKLEGYSLAGTSQIKNIVEIVEEAINDNIIESLSVENNPRLNLPKIRKNPFIEIVPICSGCLGEPCSYCIVKKARGHLVSYPKDEIIKQIKSALDDGVKEIWLSAQDTGCYGKDTNTNLIELLNEIIQIPGDYKIRLGMLNPNHALEFLDELIEIYKSDKMFKFLHVPVQSGSGKILKSMKRKYTEEQFKTIINKFREKIPEITIATDIICGFPGEDENDFSKSLDLIKEIKPDAINISRFWPRPGTEAETMENQVHGNENKKRSELITSIYHNIARMRNERWLGWKGRIIIDEIGKNNSFIGRNYAYKQVIVKGDYKIGDEISVVIKKVTSFDLRGEFQNL